MISACLRLFPRQIRMRLEQRPNLTRAIDNSAWLLLDRIFRLGVGFAISVWMARYLGPEQFGMLNYAIAFVSLFTSIATLGLDKTIVRDVLKDMPSRLAILGTAFVMRLSGSIIALVLVLAISMILRPDEPAVRVLVLIIAVTSLFQSLDVIEFWFESQVKAKYTVIARNLAFIVVSGARVMLILANAPLVYFACAIVAEAAIAAGVLLVMYQGQGQHMRQWRFNFTLARRLFHDSWPLILSGLAVIAYMRVDLIMLGEMLGNQSAGIYSAATRLSEAWYFLPMIILSTLFPYLISTRQVDRELYMNRLQRLYTLVTWVSILAAVTVATFSHVIVQVLYGEAFQGADEVLRIHAWGSIAVFMGAATSQYLLAENLPKIALYRTLIGLVVNIGLNLYLIPRWGIVGAAIATAISYYFATFSILFFKNGVGQVVMLIHSMNPANLVRHRM